MVCSLLDKPKDLTVSNFIAMRSFIADEILRYKNPYPYIDGLILRSTRKIASVPMADRERLSGHSTYTLGKLISLFSNGFTAFSIKPLRIATFTGAFCSVIGFIPVSYTHLDVYKRQASACGVHSSRDRPH